MTLAQDIADDYEFMDGVEDITFTPQNPVAAAVASVKALRGVLTRGEQYLGATAGIEPSDVVWHLWASTLSGTVPKPGDKITDSDSASYRILSLQLMTLRTRWRCVCRKDV